MHHGPKDVKAVESYSQKAHENEISASIQIFDTLNINLERG